MVWVLDDITVLHEPGHGSVQHGLLFDITARKHTELVLAEQAALMEHVARGGTLADTLQALAESVLRVTGARACAVVVDPAEATLCGLVALAVALRGRVTLGSLVIVEAPAVELLRECNEDGHYSAFKSMTEAYFSAFAAGNTEAIASMIDFYGGPGTYASWPQRVRAYAVETTPVNILDWASAQAFPLPARSLAAVAIPTLVMWGGRATPPRNAPMRSSVNAWPAPLLRSLKVPRIS